MLEEIHQATRALQDGDLVVYPTETVYGLGADGLNPTAVEKLFAVKNRPKHKPVSLAFPTVDSALDAIENTARHEAFMHEFLPGPVTVLAEPTIDIPAGVTAGKDVLGIRVPDNDIANALLTEYAPITATSANLSGQGSIRNPATLDPSVRNQIAVIIDTGDTPGGESTVVNPETKDIVRHRLLADQSEQWLNHDP
jgi:L-threonylcarbamoyladenylate synthase